MAEAPIGTLSSMEAHECMLICLTVLDGGTGFLKVGYAAQVRRGYRES
jgi:hypothetical protein